MFRWDWSQTTSDVQTDKAASPLRDIVLDLGMRPRAFFGFQQMVVLDDNREAVVERADLDGIVSALESHGYVDSYMNGPHVITGTDNPFVHVCSVSDSLTCKCWA